MDLVSYWLGRIRQVGTLVRTSCVTLILIAALTFHIMTVPMVQAAEIEDSSGTADLVTGAACFLLTPVYGAFKLAFAGAGIIIGGLTWVFTGGDDQAAQRVWDASMKGTYIITPEHLSGEKPIVFIGPTEESKP
ncbi:MAG: hypothetical protein D6690_05950 [Nitrospirae bacterium]|nr:MAG: hypothetical protein D6690_05950 [Nitrospirota bacterium]